MKEIIESRLSANHRAQFPQLPTKMASNRRSLVLFLLLTLIRIQHGQELTLSQVESRRLSRHARDEIDWAEGNNKHRKRTQSKYDETQARNELHRMEELTRKKLPTLEASATRVGNRYVCAFFCPFFCIVFAHIQH